MDTRQPNTSNLPTRQQRRHAERQRIKDERHKLLKQRKSARRPPDPLAPFYATARLCLLTGERAQQPTMRAVRKMARFLLAFPKQRMVPRHMWGPWRSWPTNIRGKTA